MVTPSDLTRSETANWLPATSIVWMLAATRSWWEVPRITTSDLSAFSCRPFRRNHRRTADEQSARRFRAGAASQAFMAMNSYLTDNYLTSFYRGLVVQKFTNSDHQTPLNYNFFAIISQLKTTIMAHTLFPKKWRQNRNHNNYDKSYQN